ncbi:MAG: ThiF family adenylyltransferase [Candidatus Sigynarchaeota archaeon]
MNEEPKPEKQEKSQEQEPAQIPREAGQGAAMTAVKKENVLDNAEKEIADKPAQPESPEPGDQEEKKECSDDANFQLERENLTWAAALSFLEQYKEDEHAIVSSKEREIYARQAILKGWNQQVLKKSRVLVAGMSKLGRELVKNLALIGVGNVTIVDPGIIEGDAAPAFLIPASPGTKSKVAIIKEQISKLNPYMKIETAEKVIEDLPLKEIKEHEIAVACMNSFKSRMYLYQVCKKFGIPYAEGAVLGIEGFVQAWMPGDEDKPVPEPRVVSAAGKDSEKEGSDDDLVESEDIAAACFSPVYADELDQDVGSSNEAAASILAGILGQEIIKIAFKMQKGDIGEVQKPRYLKYDGMTGLFDTAPDRKDLLLYKGKKYFLDKELLKKATIFIAGVGALGCEIAKDLALAGVGKLILVDLDTIETSNLSRQLLFRLEDIGRPKAEIAAKRVKELNPAVEVEFFFKKIQDLPIDMYEKCDVIIAALDNVQARFDLNVIARRVKRPMIEGGTVGFEGHVQVIVPAGAKFLAETACYRCVVPIPPPDKRLIAACTPKGIPQSREQCVLRSEFIFRKKLEREPDLKNPKDLIMLTGGSNKELEMLKERDPTKDHGSPFVPQDMENILENKIPAIQTVSAVIASIESMEAMKMACIQNATEKPEHYSVLDPTYINYNGMYGIFEHLPVLKREDCIVCGNVKGLEYVQIPITPESTIGDIFDALQKSGVITAEQKFMMTNTATKGILFHPSIASMGDKTRKLVDLGIKPGNEVLLTPFGVPKQPDGSEPMKYQVTLVSVDPAQWQATTLSPST